MSIVCLFCKKEIFELVSEATATTNAFMNENGDLIIDNESDDIFETNEWRCPECSRVLADNQYEAKRLLLDNDELKKMVEKKILEK